MRSGKMPSAEAAIVAVLLGAFLFAPCARAGLIESWENTDDGWVIVVAENPAYTSAGFSTTSGVTNGTYSWNITGTAAPTYGQMLRSPLTLANTATMAGAATISIDVLTTPGSFGFFQQWSAVVNNADTGYTSLDGFAFSQSPVIGSQSTLTWTVPAGVRTTLAGSANPTEIIFQVGGGNSAGNNSMFLDNVRTTEVPEPAMLSLVGLACVSVIRRRAWPSN